MLFYNSRSGVLTLRGQVLGIAYSGHGDGLNNPALEAEPGLGPIPRGTYIMGAPHTSQNTGPYTMDLTPVGHTAFGRSLLRMHGDNRSGDESASHGCIVTNRKIRETIWRLNDDRKLDVV